MPIGVLNFDTPTFEQSAPWLTGMSSMNNVLQQQQAIKLARAQAQLAQAQAQYAPQLAQADLAKSLLNNDLLSQQSQWYGPEAQSRVGLQGAQTNETNALAKKTGVETDFIPLDYAIKGSQTLNSASRFGQAYQLSKSLSAMDASQRNLWISQNQGAYNQMLDDLGNKGLQQQNNMGTNILTQIMRQKFPGSDDSMAIQPSKYQALAAGLNSLANGGANQPQQIPPQQGQPQVQQGLGFNTPGNATQEMQQVGNYDAYRKMAGAKINNRADAAVALESWLANNRPEYASKLNSALDYAGGEGFLQKKLDAAKGIFGVGETPQKYIDYLWAKNSLAGGLANGVRMMEGMGATDQQRKDLMDMINLGVDKIDADPKAARQLFNQAIGTMQDISDGVFESAEVAPGSKGMYRKAHNLQDYGNGYLNANDSSSQSTGSVVRMQTPDGKIWRVPSDKLSDAIKMGAKRV